MGGIGLVFAGGGGKGAYQVGVWQALRDCGLESSVTAVSGTSIGALNGAFFVQGDLERAKDAWFAIAPEKLVAPGRASGSRMARDALFDALFTSMRGGMSSLRGTVDRNELPGALLKSLAALMAGQGFSISMEGLSGIIDGAIDPWRVSGSPVSLFACASRLLPPGPEYFLCNSRPSVLKDILLASAAIMEPARYVDGIPYLDGGLFDNAPAGPLYEMGISDMVAVHLSPDAFLDRSRFPRARILEIRPGNSLGGFLGGTLDFSAGGARWRYRQGYEDGFRVLAPVAGISGGEGTGGAIPSLPG